MKHKQKKYLLGGIGSSAILLIVFLTLTTQKPSQPTLAIDSSTGGLVITKADITETASFYPYESNGTYMEIIAVRASDDTVRTALNTCQVCYNSGNGYYEQLGNALICKNCGNQFTIDQIQVVKGGCNPVPILEEMKVEDDSTITISPKALELYEPLFENWKL